MPTSSSDTDCLWEERQGIAWPIHSLSDISDPDNPIFVADVHELELPPPRGTVYSATIYKERGEHTEQTFNTLEEAKAWTWAMYRLTR